jgi:hypothetical protein
MHTCASGFFAGIFRIPQPEHFNISSRVGASSSKVCKLLFQGLSAFLGKPARG